MDGTRQLTNIVLSLPSWIMKAIGEDIKARFGVDYDERIREILSDYYATFKEKSKT